MRKVERQYLEMAGPKPESLRIQDVTVEAYLQRFQWDFAQYQQQGRQLGELVTQIQAMAGKVDEDLKTLNTSYMDKTVALAAAKRKKVINLTTSDLEDFLTQADMKRIDVLDTEHLLTVFVVVPASLEQGMPIMTTFSFPSHLICYPTIVLSQSSSMVTEISASPSQHMVDQTGVPPPAELARTTANTELRWSGLRLLAALWCLAVQ